MTAPLPMTTGRRVALILGVPVALGIIGWTGVTEVAYAGQASYPVHLSVPVTGRTVSLSVGSADLRVTQATGRWLRLTGTADYSIIRSTVTWHATPSGVAVSPQCHFPAGACSFSFAATLPAGKPALLSSDSGNIRADTLSGSVNIQAGSGDITATALSGPKVTLQSGSGSISVTGLASADVVASAGGGDITLVFSKVPRYVSISDSFGDVSLVLPPGPTHYLVSTSADFGSTSVTVPTRRVPGPMPLIKVTDSAGDISIT